MACLLRSRSLLCSSKVDMDAACRRCKATRRNVQSGVMQLLRLLTVLALLGHVHLSAAGRAVLQTSTAPPPPYGTGMFSIPPPPRTTQHRFAECNVHVNILAVISRVHVLRQKLYISTIRVATWHPIALCWFCQRLVDAEVAHHILRQ